MNLHVLGQRALREQVKQRHERRIVRRQLKFLRAPDMRAAHAQRNAGEHAREIAGDIAAVDVRRTRNARQRKCASVRLNLRRRVRKPDPAGKGTRFRIVRDKVAVVPRPIRTLHDMRARSCEENLIHGGLGRRKQRKQAQRHPCLIGTEDSLRLLIINLNIVDRHFMQ